MPLRWKPHYTINFNGWVKVENVINEEDIEVSFSGSRAVVGFTNYEKKEIFTKIINTDKGYNLYKKLLQKAQSKELFLTSRDEDVFKLKKMILKVMNDLIKQSKYSKFLENE